MFKFTLKILWLNNNIAIAIDQLVGYGTSPLTPYFFWPRNDAWEQLRIELESKPWILKETKIELLNSATEIINYWQEEGGKISLSQVQSRFPSFIFAGSH
uniref:Probable small ribosomal subunit protein cS23 n=1 Tax=Hildenbrandia rivularis TaxID=135206 RepID=A0A1C9CFQ6_9FLOR|nr:putative ribosomal protein 3 [Hildenbrandia rivularis]AOM67199.1 putative ribosomal protein 3 [Hildenbrandia rivularis]